MVIEPSPGLLFILNLESGLHLIKRIDLHTTCRISYTSRHTSTELCARGVLNWRAVTTYD